MRRNIRTVLFAMLVAAQAAGAQNVSKTQQKANVLLEDFTGYECGNCPDGHKIAAKLQLSHPDRVFPMSVHAGPYAVPSGADAPDFRTAEGTEINDYFGVTSYPIGMANRIRIEGMGQLLSRSYWTVCCRQLCTLDADVNVWVESSYDKDTKKLTADVELYYVNGVADGTSALCVSLLQNGILGPQAGGDMEDEYVHNHVLRAMLTPVWGDTISLSAAGTLVTSHYEYDVPDVIGTIATDPLHSEIVAYVINAGKEVMNVNGCSVECPGMTLPDGATLEEYKIAPSRNYGFDFYDCYLVNSGTSPITGATFRMTFDGEESRDFAWTAAEGEEVPGLERGHVRFPVSIPEKYVKAGCDYKIALTGINGEAYNGNTVKGSFGAMINVSGDLDAAIKIDRQSSDNTFRLINAKGETVAEYGPYPDGEAETKEETVSFPAEGIYCFEITDAWGNGILSPRGSLKIKDGNGNMIVNNNEISDFGYRVFFNYSKTDGISAVQTDKKDGGAVYNIMGQRVPAAAKGGIYISDGKKITK